MNRISSVVAMLVLSVGCSRARIYDTSVTGLSARDSGADGKLGDSGLDDPPPAVVLNEVMANGAEADDWLEVVNLEPFGVDLSGWRVSDDWEEDDAWALPPGTWLAPGARLVVVADDGLTADSQLSGTFKLSSDGEVLTLVDAFGVVADEVQFPPLEVDTAYARLPDGTGAWGVTTVPTKGTVNVGE